MILRTQLHYKVIRSLETMEDIRSNFPDGKADEFNWFFASTSGAHGTYTTIDQIEKSWDLSPDDENYRRSLTVLIVHPRLCVLKFGEVEIRQRDDITFLRGLVSSTIEAIKESQKGNYNDGNPGC